MAESNDKDGEFVLAECDKQFDRYWKAGHFAMHPLGGDPFAAQKLWRDAWVAANEPRSSCPPTVILGDMVESNGRVTWCVFLSKSPDAKPWDNLQVYADTIKGRAEYEAARLRHFFGQGPKPDLMDFDTDAPRHESAPDRWIPVAERLPDDDITVMIALKDEDEPVWLGYHDEHGWHSATDSAPLGDKVLGWKPMPEGMPHG